MLVRPGNDDDIAGPMQNDQEQAVMTHQQVLYFLARAGLSGVLANTGGGCLAYEIPLEAGRYVLVTSIVDVLGPVRTSDDEGWSAGVYCAGCGEDHDQFDVHANVVTDDSSASALLAALKDLLRREARGVR